MSIIHSKVALYSRGYFAYLGKNLCIRFGKVVRKGYKIISLRHLHSEPTTQLRQNQNEENFFKKCFNTDIFQ